jgi:hypothetical protein
MFMFRTEEPVEDVEVVEEVPDVTMLSPKPEEADAQVADSG